MPFYLVLFDIENLTNSIPAEVALIYTMHEALGGYCQGLGTAHEGGECDQSIGCIVSGAIVRS